MQPSYMQSVTHFVILCLYAYMYACPAKLCISNIYKMPIEKFRQDIEMNGSFFLEE